MVKRVDVANGGAALALIGIAVLIAVPTRRDIAPGASRLGGHATLRDAGGVEVPLERYVRIISGSTVVDRLLLELCEPDRIAAFSEFTGLTPEPFRFSGRPTLDGRNDPEAILALHPDLVIVHNLPELQRMTKLRAHGVRVFDLGVMGGAASLARNIVTVGQLVGRADRARTLANEFTTRMAAVAARIPPGARRTAMYLGVHTGKMMGGTAGTSFHDVLDAAGLIDVAAKRFVGWPRYVPEQILELDPEIIVTQPGMKESICGQPGLGALRACGPTGRVVEVQTELILDSGLPMLEAAERVFQAVY